MSFGIEIRIQTKPGQFEWQRMRPTGGTPYEWETLQEASLYRRMCYPEQDGSEVRIIELKGE